MQVTRTDRHVLGFISAFVIVGAALIYWHAHPAQAAGVPVPASDLPDFELCAAWHVDGSPELTKELEARRILTPAERQAADAGRIFVGMSETAVACAFGYPDDMQDLQTADGLTSYDTYQLPGERHPMVVTFYNGTVRSFRY